MKARIYIRGCQCNPNIGKFCDDYPFCPYGYQESLTFQASSRRESNDNCNVCGMSEKEVKAHWDDKEPGFHFFKPKTAAEPAAPCFFEPLHPVMCAIHNRPWPQCVEAARKERDGDPSADGKSAPEARARGRAEKAEAEVEQLTNILRDILKHVGLCHDSSDSNLNSFYTWIDDTLGGGGRESGMEAPTGTSSTQINSKTEAAANPAACTCAVIIGHGPCPVHGWSAARKENPKT